MKIYRAQTPQNLALTKILHKFRKTSTPLVGVLQLNDGGIFIPVAHAASSSWDPQLTKVGVVIFFLLGREIHENYRFLRARGEGCHPYHSLTSDTCLPCPPTPLPSTSAKLVQSKLPSAILENVQPLILQ